MLAYLPISTGLIDAFDELERQKQNKTKNNNKKDISDQYLIIIIE